MEALLKGSDGLDQAKRVHGEADDPSDKVGSGRSSSSSDHKSNSSSPEHEDSVISNGKQTSPVRMAEISSMNACSRPSQMEFSSNKQQLDKLNSAKAEMGEMKEENERLKMILARIVKDYQSLQMQFSDVVQQEQTKNNTESASNSDQEMEEEPELVSLRLGTAPISKPKKQDQVEVSKSSPNKEKDERKQREGLTLGLDCKFDDTIDVDGPKDAAKSESAGNSFEEAANAGGEQPWPPSKTLKTQRSVDADELSQQAQVKKARVSVRARCNAPTMNDGCQWRKYGQKIAKGNPCPRAYYRCTVAPGCPVRKQVQRCADDMTILITTYEGTHNHPLPISATAMASTTSAAACMLMSGSSTSGRQVLGASAPISTSTSADLHGLNFGLSDINHGSSRPFYLSNHSISSSPSYPTITLDLTAPPSTTNNSQFSRFSSSIPSFPKPSTSFNFTTAESSTGLISPWSSTGNNYISYNTSQSPYSKTQFGSFNLAATQPAQDHMYQPYMQKNATNDPPQAGLSETIAAATKVLTSDPNFRSALAAAITSIVSNGNGSSSANGRGDAQIGHGMKWGEQFHSLAPFTAAAAPPTTNSCAPIYRSSTNAPSSNQTGNFMFLPSNSSPFSSAKSSTPSPVDNKGHPS